jgi:hypothetical protein
MGWDNKSIFVLFGQPMANLTLTVVFMAVTSGIAESSVPIIFNREIIGAFF